MTGSDLAARVAKREQMSVGQAAIIVDMILDCLKDSLRRGERVEIRGLGTFQVRRYQGYVGRNPKTGQPIEVAPKRLPYFKASVTLLRNMNTHPSKISLASSRGDGQHASAAAM